MTTKIKVYRYSGNDEYAEMPALLDSDGDDIAAGAIIFATALGAEGAADTLQHVLPTAGLPVQQQTGATWTVSAASLPLPTGAATAANQTTANTALAAIQTAVETLDNAVSGSEIQVDVVAAIPSGDNAIGRVKITDGTDVADVELLDDSGVSGASNGIAVGACLHIKTFAGDWTPLYGVTPADNTAALSLVPFLAFGMMFDGTFWDRVRGDATNGLLVNLGANNDVTVTSGSITANAGTNLNTSALALESGGNLAAIAAAVAAEGSALGSGVLLQGDDGTDRTNVLVDTDGHLQVDVLSGGGSATQYTEDAVAAADPVGGALIMVRADTLAGVTSADGDNVAARGTDKGELYVKHVDAIPVTDNSGSLTVDNGGTFVVQENGAALTALQLIDDAVYTDGAGTPSKGIAVMGTDGTNPQLISVDASGNVQVDLVSANVTNAGTFAVQVDGTALTRLTDIETNTDFGAVTGGGTETGALRVTIANNSTGVLSVDDNGGSLTVDAAELTTLAGAVSGTEMQVDVVAALPAGTNNIGDVDVASIAAGTNLIGDVGLQPRTSGGLTIFRSIDLDESEEEIKSSAGQVYGIIAINLATGVRYLKLYNATAANVTVGTTTPVMTIPIPTQGTANGAGFFLMLPQGIVFDTAITAAATTGVADNDTGAPGANEVVVNILYK